MDKEISPVDVTSADCNTSLSDQHGTTTQLGDLSEYGIHRGLQSHHIQLLAISGVIGTGLFVGTSSVLHSAGPAGLLIGYCIWCVFLLCVAHAMGEMSAYLPVPGSFATHIGRFIDESAGVAMGWVYAYRKQDFHGSRLYSPYGLWSYWFDVNPGVWVAVTLSVVFVLNCLAVKYFGEAEFYASIFKVFLVLGFLVFTFVVVVGGNPHHDRIGFRYWKNPGAFNEAYTTGNTGRFLGIWGVFNTAAFAIGGPDFIANCAPETVNPRRNIPKAVRRVIYRLIFFFILSVFAVGMLVPYNDPTMLTAIATGNGVAKSPFIIAMNRLEIPFLPDLCNALVGVPLPALILSVAVASLAFMSCNTGSAVVLNWFINLGSTAIMIAYILMMIANLRFHAGLKAQGISVESLPFKSPFTPYSNYFAIFWVGIILLTNGYGVFIHGYWQFSGFFTAYFTIVLFIVIYLGWKITKRTPFIKPEDMDFQTGMAEVTAHEAQLLVKKPATRYEKLMDWLW